MSLAQELFLSAAIVIFTIAVVAELIWKIQAIIRRSR